MYDWFGNIQRITGDKMKKAIIILLTMFFLFPSLAFAQNERMGSIIGTLGMGIAARTTVETEALGSVIFDLNLIHKTGFTLCLTDVTVFSAAGTSRYLMPGTGYNYLRDKWSIGGAVLVAPMAGDIMIAGKLNGGYFFSNNIGITGILMYSGVVGLMSYDFSMFNAFAGVSVRL
jgi:hypothetical protein